MADKTKVLRFSNEDRAKTAHGDDAQIVSFVYFDGHAEEWAGEDYVWANKNMVLPDKSGIYPCQFADSTAEISFFDSLLFLHRGKARTYGVVCFASDGASISRNMAHFQQRFDDFMGV